MARRARGVRAGTRWGRGGGGRWRPLLAALLALGMALGALAPAAQAAGTTY